MENQSNRTVTIAVVTGIIALLFGLCAGALLGGLGGYAVGRQAAARARFTSPGLAPLPVPGGTRVVPAPLPGGANGVSVQSVIAGSPAAQAGIQAGDVIVQIDDTPLDANTLLTDVIGNYKPGDTLQMTIDRLGRQVTVRVRLGSYPGDAQRPYLGIRYSQAAPEQAPGQPPGQATPTP